MFGLTKQWFSHSPTIRPQLPPVKIGAERNMGEPINPPCPMARYLREEITRLRMEWEPLVAATPPPPPLTWDDLKETLLDGVESPLVELAIRGALAGLLKTAPEKSPEQVLREILILGSSALDPDFGRTAKEWVEAPMP